MDWTRKVNSVNAEKRYADFGPTLMAEQLAKEKLLMEFRQTRMTSCPRFEE